MHGSRDRTGSLANSSYSSNVRRDVLWNVVEPGDPYDIRNSMIAQLPGESNRFMGDNLEVVCLMQSAEIERLCQFLDDYRYRYREMERKQLDRHSYEIQIKELTQRLAEEGSFKVENTKLKDFIKKLTQENEELKGNRYNSDSSLRTNYENSLSQIQILTRENNNFKSEISSLTLQINNYKAKIEAIESAKERQIRELFDRYSSESKTTIEIETREVRSRFQSEINRLEFQIKRLKEFNEAKNEDITELTNKNRSLLSQIEELHRQSTLAVSSTTSNYEERFALFGQEIERLNMILKESSFKLDDASRNQLLWQEKYNRMEVEYRSLESTKRQLEDQIYSLKQQIDNFRYESSRNQSAELQAQITRLKNEIRRLELERSQQGQRYTTLESKYRDLEYQVTKITIIERENQELKAGANNSQDLKKRIAEYQNKIALLSQQVERLTQLNASHELNRRLYEDMKIDFDDFKRKSFDNEKSITQRYESELQKRILQYETKIHHYAQQNGTQFEDRLRKVNLEMERLNTYLKDKTEEAENHKRRIRELESSIHSKYEVEVTRKISTFESTISELRFTNEELIRKNREMENLGRRIPEYENKITYLTQELDNLKLTLKSRNEELENSLRKFKELEGKFINSSNTMEMETTRKFAFYEQTQIKLQNQNADMRRKLQDIVELQRSLREYENKFAIMNQEIQRLNLALKTKIDALTVSENQIRNFTFEIETLKRQRTELETSLSYKMESINMDASRKVTTIEQNLQLLQRENQDLRRKYNELSNEHKRKIAEYENKIAIMKDEIERINSTSRDNSGRLARENQELKRALQEHDIKMKTVIQEYETFRRQVKDFEGEVSNRNNNASKQIEDLRRKLAESDVRVQNLTLQNERIIRNSQQQLEKLNRRLIELQNQLNTKHDNVSLLVRERDDVIRAMKEYETRVGRDLEESRRRNLQLENQLRQISQQLELWRNKHKQLEYTITNKYEVETTRKYSTYEQTIQTQIREIENYRLRVTEFENMRKNYELELQNLRSRIGEYEVMRKNYEQNNMKNNQEAEKLILRIRELETSITQKYEVETSRKITIYEQNLSGLTTQNEELRRVISNHQQNISRLNRQLEELRRVLQDHGELQRVKTEYERQINMLKQDLERINGLLQKKSEEYLQLENRYRNDTEKLSRQLKETEINITNSYTMKTTTIEQNLVIIQRDNEQLKKRLTNLSQQFQRLNSAFKAKTDELAQSENKIRNLQQELEKAYRTIKEVEANANKRFETEFSRTSSMFEQKTVTITREYESYKVESNRRFSEYENKIALLSQELERVNNNLKMKNDEAINLSQQLKNALRDIENLNRSLQEQQQMNSRRFETQLSRTVSTYETKFTSVTRQYEEYRRTHQNKYLQMQAEIERLNAALRVKVDELTQHDRIIKELEMTIGKMQKNLRQTEEGWRSRYETEVSKTSSSYEQNIITLRSTLTEHERKINDLKRKSAEDENRIALLSQEVQRLNQALRVKMDEMMRHQAEVETLKGHFTAEIERLNLVLRQKLDEIASLQQRIAHLQANQQGDYKQLQNSYALVTKEYESSKTHLAEYEQSIQKLYSEFQRLQIIINELKTERQTLFEKNHGLIQEIERLMQINNDQEGQISELRLRLSDDVALQKRIQEHMGLMVVLFAEIETLRQRVKDKEQEVKEVRRSSLAPFKA